MRFADLVELKSEQVQTQPGQQLKWEIFWFANLKK